MRAVRVSIGVVVQEADERSAWRPRALRGAALSIRGRADEVDAVAGLLRSVAAGQSGALVVRGDAGVGRSRLLQEAIGIATRAGRRIVVLRPGPDSRLIPLAPLLDAMTAGPDPIVSTDDLGSGDGASYRLLSLLQEALERAAAASGVLVVVDDLQRCDATTLAVLRALALRLAGAAVGWLVAVRSGADDPAVDDMVAVLAHGGSALDLRPLAETAVTEVIGDLLGAAPDAGVLAVAERAERMPLLLVELIGGLIDEDLVAVLDGRAVLGPVEVPQVFGTAVRERLRRLSPAGRQVVELGALLGRRFTARPLAVLLGDRASELLVGLREAIGAGLVVELDDGFAFRHDVIREVAESLLPGPLRRMLARTAITELLREGEPVLALVKRLAEVADPGDVEAVAAIRDAAVQLWSSDLRTAVRLARRALDLSAGSPSQAALLAELAPLLWADGRSDEVLRRIEDVRPRLEPDEGAHLALVVARMQSECSTADALRTVASALALPGVGPAARARLLAVKALNLAHSGAVDGIRATMDEARRLAERTADESVVATLEATESVLAFYEWRFADADRWIRSASSRIAGRPDAGSPAWLPEGLWLACLAVSLGDRRSASRTMAPSIPAAASAQMQARDLLDRGRLGEARTLAESILATSGPDPDSFAAVTAGQTLFRIALAQADRPAADRYRRFASTEHRSQALHRAGRWLLALEAELRGDHDDVLALTDEAWLAFELPVASMSNPPDFADDITLTRMSVRAGLTDRLEVVERVATARAAANPTDDLCAGVADHVRGLIRRSPDDLASAVVRFRGIGRPLLLASALEDLGCALLRSGDDGASVPWAEAERLHAAAGAGRDEDRVRQRLRSIGVRRRGTVPTNASGLTDRELQVVERVAAGQTTAQIARDLSISTHTVVTHVRHVYVKWGVTTRRQLGRRFAGDHARPPAHSAS